MPKAGVVVQRCFSPCCLVHLGLFTFIGVWGCSAISQAPGATGGDEAQQADVWRGLWYHRQISSSTFMVGF